MAAVDFQRMIIPLKHVSERYVNMALTRCKACCSRPGYPPSACKSYSPDGVADRGTCDVIHIAGKGSPCIVELRLGLTISAGPIDTGAAVPGGGDPFRRERQLGYHGQVKGGSNGKREHSPGG